MRSQRSSKNHVHILSAFDTLRTSIHKVASKAYSHGRRSFYTLTAADFL
ncbi:MAG: DUF1488 family protein [Mesorhizobium sp.]|nr:DUF1488 family protein [bacterium M00.F.Ca.ET.205.01.1.1]TGU46691.1 DUF1488 family protein [bacterium M00.F.Ca.ET.152.01.1.1]TGV31788.1 DUF1488 family protein [Mesorhizobium sp. M00.F.Ca.ET.186.01.1.1]TGZ38956.1 DUF1488 family protein [bacterium M00.F.Ca.ET.162.01.1.1]TIW63101.1 MAG: DUF1488 family protein [Mesorhizobium sp.]